MTFTEIINQDTGLVVDKGDSVGLYNAISEIRENTKAKYSQACINRAKEKYNKDEAFEQYVTLYKSLLK